MKLRWYQEDVKTEIYNAWENGAKNVSLVVPTGGGKTVIFSDILAEEKDFSVVIAHRVEILSQISVMLGRYGIRHNIISPQSTIRNIVSAHMFEFKKSFYNSQARCTVAAVDTLINLKPEQNQWFKKVKLVVQDEGHHVLADNKWGTAAALFPNARGLYPTATPSRTDGKGLGRHADGIVDKMVVGISTQELMDLGFLSKYKIIGSNSDIDLSDVPISKGGDYSPRKLETAVHRSRITGDIIKTYLKFAAGKLGIAFTVDIKSAIEVAQQFREAGVPAEVITGKTPPVLRSQIMQKFRQRLILVLVNVDCLGEGVDVPAVEVVILAKPTLSLITYQQQIGRALRIMAGKDYATIIDHVGNWGRHGLPEKPRVWTLDRRERRRSDSSNEIPLKNCLNTSCLAVYERFRKKCPFCGYYTPPAERGAPEFVDGDLTELDPEILAKLRGEIVRVDGGVKIPQNLDEYAQRAVSNRHYERQRAQAILRKSIALWAGHQKYLGREDSEIYRRFYFAFNIDIASAQALGAKAAEELNYKIEEVLITEGVTEV